MKSSTSAGRSSRPRRLTARTRCSVAARWRIRARPSGPVPRTTWRLPGRARTSWGVLIVLASRARCRGRPSARRSRRRAQPDLERSERPAAAPGGTARSIAARSSADNRISSAPSASARRSRRRAPTSGTMSSPRCRTQAIAIWATVALLVSATARSASTSERLRSRFAPLKRGAVRRKSPSVTSRSLDQCPLRRPRDSTPYAVTPTPSSRQVGRISASMPRESSEYSICRSATG